MNLDELFEKNQNKKIIIGAHIAVFIVWLPMLLNRQYFMDWVNNYWLILATENQFFPQWNFGKVYGLIYLEPWHKYYGGYIFAILSKMGWIAEEIGVSKLFVYRLIYISIAQINLRAATVIAHKLGCRKAIAVSVGTLYACNPYMITNAFGRGAFSEFVATGMILPIVALLLTINESKFVSVYNYIFLCGLFTILITTHIVTSLNLVLFCIIGLIIFLRYRRPTRKIKIHELQVLLAFFSSCLFSAPVIILLFLGNDFLIKKSMSVDDSYSSMTQIFWPVPKTPTGSTTPGLKTQLLGLLFAWSFIAMIFLRKKLSISNQKIVLRLLSMLVVSILFVTTSGIWNYIPFWFSATQFSYRYITFSNLLIFVLACIAGNLVSDDLRSSKIVKPIRNSLYLLAVISLTLSANQTYSAENPDTEVTMSEIDGSKLPPTWYAIGDYRKRGTVEIFDTLPFIVENQTNNSVSGWLVCTDRDNSRFVQLPIASGYWQKVKGLYSTNTSIHGQITGKIKDCDFGETVYISVESGANSAVYRGIYVGSFLVGIVALMFATRINVRGRRKAIPYNSRSNL